MQGFNLKFVRCSPTEIQTKRCFGGYFSGNSPVALVPIEEMMNSRTYLPIIEKRVFRKLPNLHPQAIFQQDFASCHKAKIITNYFKKMKMEVLEWPGNFPDLNLIENQWSIMKNRWRKQDCTKKQADSVRNTHMLSRR